MLLVGATALAPGCVFGITGRLQSASAAMPEEVLDEGQAQENPYAGLSVGTVDDDGNLRRSLKATGLFASVVGGRSAGST